MPSCIAWASDESSAAKAASSPSGALVADVWPDGAAARGGLRQGDVVTSIDGHPVVDAAAVNFAVGTHRPGDALKIGVRRGAGEQAFNFKAEAAPALPARDERLISGRNPFEGATVVNLSPAVADELGLDPFSGPGVLVSKIAGGAAQRVGLQPGDFIRSVNGRDIKSVRDLSGAVSVPVPVWQVTIERNGQQVTATFRT